MTSLGLRPENKRIIVDRGCKPGVLLDKNLDFVVGPRRRESVRFLLRFGCAVAAICLLLGQSVWGVDRVEEFNKAKRSLVQQLHNKQPSVRVEALGRMGDAAGCASARASYLARWPNGTYRRAVELGCGDR